MKSKIFYLAILFSLLFINCSKDDDDTANLNSEITGEWYLYKVEYNYTNNNPNYKDYTPDDNIVFKFKKDGMLEINKTSEAYHSGTYGYELKIETIYPDFLKMTLKFNS